MISCSHNKMESLFIYLCGNSLGLQPKAAREVMNVQMNNWQNLAVEGWFEGDSPWMFYHKALKKLIAANRRRQCAGGVSYEYADCEPAPADGQFLQAHKKQVQDHHGGRCISFWISTP